MVECFGRHDDEWAAVPIEAIPNGPHEITIGPGPSRAARSEVRGIQGAQARKEVLVAAAQWKLLIGRVARGTHQGVALGRGQLVGRNARRYLWSRRPVRDVERANSF